MKLKQTGGRDINAVITYQTNRDYNTDELINFDRLIDFLMMEAQHEDKKTHDLNDFKKKVVSIGSRTTLKDELKISATEALNYLMGFPLNFNLEPFMKLFDDVQFGLPNHEPIDKLKSNFDKKKKLIKQNFKSKTHIDVKEFKEWAKSRGFIKKKNKPVGVIKKPKVITGLSR